MMKNAFAVACALASASALASVTLYSSHPAAKSAAALLGPRTGSADVRLYVDGKMQGFRHDGYVASREGDSIIIVATRPRALLYAAGEPGRWLGVQPGRPVRREAAFASRMLNYTGSGHTAAEWVAATGANIIHLARNERTRHVQECRDADVECYAFLYGCDPSKWSRGRFEAYIAEHPEARGVERGRSWEKGVMCPSSPATKKFFMDRITELATSADYDGVVVTFWDDFGLHCACEKCRQSGLDGFPKEITAVVGWFEEAMKAVGKKLIVRTWASGAPHFLRDEWVNAPGYSSEEDAIATWGQAFEKSSPSTVFQTKVYNADCQPNPPFSLLLGKARGRREFAEWQITGQTVGLQYFPASVVDHTAWTVRKAFGLVGSEGGVCLYAGGYKRHDYEALDDPANSINIYAWRQLTWDPEDSVDRIWAEWAEPLYGERSALVTGALKVSEGASVVAFSPLGLGAPTESHFAGNVTRREDLLRYTNRQYLKEGRAAMRPSTECIAAVVEEKNKALSLVATMKDKLAAAIEGAEPDAAARIRELQNRTDLLEKHLVVSKALDGALWRLRRLRRLKDMGVSDANVMRDIENDFSTIRANPYPLSAELGSPVPLMCDIHSNALVCVERILGPEWNKTR